MISVDFLKGIIVGFGIFVVLRFLVRRDQTPALEGFSAREQDADIILKLIPIVVELLALGRER